MLFESKKNDNELMDIFIVIIENKSNRTICVQHDQQGVFSYLFCVEICRRDAKEQMTEVVVVVVLLYLFSDVMRYAILFVRIRSAANDN